MIPERRAGALTSEKATNSTTLPSEQKTTNKFNAVDIKPSTPSSNYAPKNTIESAKHTIQTANEKLHDVTDVVSNVAHDTKKMLANAKRILDAFDPELGEKAIDKMHLRGVANVMNKAVKSSTTSHTFNAVPIGLCPDLTGLDPDTLKEVDKGLQCIVSEILLEVAQVELNDTITFQRLEEIIDKNVFVKSVNETEFPELKATHFIESKEKTITSTFSKAKEKIPELESEIFEYIKDNVKNDWLLDKLAPEMKKIAELVVNTDAGGGFFSSKKTTKTDLFSFSFMKMPSPKMPYVQICFLNLHLENVSTRVLGGLTRKTHFKLRLEYASRCVTSSNDALFKGFTDSEIEVESEEFMAMFAPVPDCEEQQLENHEAREYVEDVEREVDSGEYDEKNDELLRIQEEKEFNGSGKNEDLGKEPEEIFRAGDGETMTEKQVEIEVMKDRGLKNLSEELEDEGKEICELMTKLQKEEGDEMVCVEHWNEERSNATMDILSTMQV